MNGPSRTPVRAFFTLPGGFVPLAAIVAAGLWLWICWCLFPGRGWNDVRLAPIFGLKLGLPLYGGATAAASTWMYGPLPVLLLWPATWAAEVGQALLVADTINLVILLGAIITVCALWPLPESTRAPAATRIMAAALVVIVFPASMWQYLQADNTAVAVGLLSNLVLMLHRSNKARWGAALLAGAALFCKQTSLAVPAAQLIWLAGDEGRTAARDHAVRLLVAGAAGATLLLLWQDPRAVLLNLIVTPGHLPWTDQPWDRLHAMWKFFAVHAGLPALVWLWLRRTDYRSGLTLPTLTWLCAWLPGIAGFLKIGGTVNNLQSFPLWLPPALVLAVAAGEKKIGARRTWLLAATAVVLVCLWRVNLEPAPPLRPTVQLYAEAEILAKAYPGQIWFPWHPLVTVFSEQSLYHVEDGLYVRIITARPTGYAALLEHLPPRMRAIALPLKAGDTSLALRLLPPNASRTDLGLWRLYIWPPPTSEPSAPVLP